MCVIIVMFVVCFFFTDGNDQVYETCVVVLVYAGAVSHVGTLWLTSFDVIGFEDPLEINLDPLLLPLS